MHLNEVERESRNLLNEVSMRLGRSLPSCPLVNHYDNEDDFAVYPGVRELDRDEFLLVTGDKSHFLLPQPSVPNCPYHDWQKCRRDGVPSNPGPLVVRSVAPRSFFISGEPHHCAHRDVYNAKASPITAANRDRCGARSGLDGQAFCEIWWPKGQSSV